MNSRLVAIAIILFGVFVGVGFYTFGYAAGLSYFSSDPAACDNCHIMNDQYASWQRGPHHGNAACIDCHLPHALVPKLIAKAQNGYHHSTGFTLQNFHEPILIKPGNSRILQENCLRCHGDFMHSIVPATSDPEAVRCVRCHRGVGHGARGV